MNNEYKNESVLVIVLCETRAYQHTFELFKKNMLDIVHADLCLCVANNSREDKDNPFYQHAKYIWAYEEPDDWGKAFDFIQKQKGLQEDWRKLLQIKDQWLGGIKGSHEHPGSAGILLFFRWFLKYSLIKNNIIDKYERFIITRSDFIHKIPHVPLKFLDSKKIWIPYGEDYGGYTDRHIVVSNNEILNVLSITDKIMTNPNELYSEMTFSTTWNLEKYIKFSFNQLNLLKKVKRFPYTMYTVRAADGHTRWSSGTFNQKLGYFIKYESEFKS